MNDANDANDAKRPSFEIEQINRADGEITIVIREPFTEAFSTALLEWRQPWNGQPNPAIASVGQYVRDGGRILRGEPVDRFPRIKQADLVSDVSAYEDTGELAAEVEDTADTGELVSV